MSACLVSNYDWRPVARSTIMVREQSAGLQSQIDARPVPGLAMPATVHQALPAECHTQARS